MTPSVSPGANDDDDVSKGALPDVCVPLQLRRRKALTTITRPGAFYHVGSRCLHLLCTMDERHAHTPTSKSYTLRSSFTVPQLTPLSAPICVNMSNPGTQQLIWGKKQSLANLFYPYSIPCLYQEMKLCINRASSCLHIRDLQTKTLFALSFVTMHFFYIIIMCF